MKKLKPNPFFAAILAMAGGFTSAAPARRKNTDNWPHQGPRECARRRGGAHWMAAKMAHRESRGLPARE